jgi:hypothetical protein
MSLLNQYTHTITLKRLTAIAGTKKEDWQAVAGDIVCAIHPVEGTQQEMLEGGFYNTFKMFCDDATDIRIGDKVIDGSTEYTVKGIKTYDMASNTSIRHKNITLVKGA